MAKPSGTSVGAKSEINDFRDTARPPRLRLRDPAIQTSDPGISRIPTKRYKATTMGRLRSNENWACSKRAETGAIIPAALVNAPKTRIRTRIAKSNRFANGPMEERCSPFQRFLPGITASRPTLSCGHALTQSKQNVQSTLLFFFG